MLIPILEISTQYTFSQEIKGISDPDATSPRSFQGSFLICKTFSPDEDATDCFATTIMFRRRCIL